MRRRDRKFNILNYFNYNQKKEAMRCMVTGGAGFIGANLAIALEALGAAVIVIDDFSSGSRENLHGFRGKIVKHDLSSPWALNEPIDVIFHQAGITDPRFPDPSLVLECNIRSFANILALADRKNAKLVYASTASLYGNTPSPQAEDQRKELLTAYAQSKLIIDEMASHHFANRPLIGLRYFNVYGPGEASKGQAASMILHLVRRMLLGKRPQIFSDGEQSRDHVYIKDCVAANLCALSAQSGIYNVGTGVPTTFNDLVALLNRLLGTKLEPEYINNPYGSTYQVRTQANTDRARRLLNFESSWSLCDGIQDYFKRDMRALKSTKVTINSQ
jgi:ADP-L-glycero-D-manno-heptose 6-epimerase